MRTRPQPKLRESAAFTLLEIVVAITVFMFIMISILGCWKCIVTGTMIAKDAAAAAQRARIGIKTVEQALTCAEIDRSINNIWLYSFDTGMDSSGNFSELRLTARLPPEFPGSHLFGDLVVRRVSFEVETDSGGTNNLIMRQWPFLEALDDANTAYPITLARDVIYFKLEYWNQRDAEWDDTLLDTNNFPPRILVTLGCGHTARDPSVPYTYIVRDVAMPCVPHN